MGWRGGWAMRSSRDGSRPRARAGSPLVIRLIQRIWIGAMGWAQPSSDAMVTANTSPALEANRNVIKRRMLE